VVGLTVLAPPASADPPAIPDSARLTWSIKLNASSPATPGMGQTTPTTTTEFARHPLTAAVNTVEATLDATVPGGSRAAADVPGLRVEGTWSEWVDITPDSFGVLPESTRLVRRPHRVERRPSLGRGRLRCLPLLTSQGRP
jgi:hypothetical protein